jgi:methanogenic corrinoid protein MtbC1
MNDPLYPQFFQALSNGETQRMCDLARTALSEGRSVDDLFVDVVQPAFEALDLLWREQRISAFEVTQMVGLAQQFVHECLHMVPPAQSRDRTVVIAGVEDENHDLGLRMLASSFDIDGWLVYYVGNHVPIHELIQIVQIWRPELLALSATRDHSVHVIATTINALRDSAHQPLVMVGGKAFERAPGSAERIGADLYARSVRDAIQVANHWFDHTTSRRSELTTDLPVLTYALPAH